MKLLAFVSCSSLLLVGCDRPTAPSATVSRVSAASAAVGNNRVVAAVTGDAVVDLTSAGVGFMQLTVTAHQRANGAVDGTFTETRDAAAGGTVDFTGQVTCLAFDQVNHRAWVGGVITENRSTNPAFRDGAIFQPGRDIWFRTSDYGEGPNDPRDRATTFGFTGSGGIDTSPHYCAAMLWPMTPVPDVRTFPVSDGNIQIHGN